MIAFSPNPKTELWDPVRHKSTKNRNVWVPTSLYWNSRERINLPYVPYFSNCKGFGNFIPFWALLEQHHVCELIPKEETQYMNMFDFGGSPTADSCEEFTVECMYDEVFYG
jgi:hypothetical protein